MAREEQMRPSGKREIAEGVLIGTILAICSEVIAWTVGNHFRRLKEREDAKKKEAKKRKK